MSPSQTPLRGEVWMVELGIGRGREAMRRNYSAGNCFIFEGILLKSEGGVFVVQETNECAATSSIPEDLFVELFTQVFGLEKALFFSRSARSRTSSREIASSITRCEPATSGLPSRSMVSPGTYLMPRPYRSTKTTC